MYKMIIKLAYKNAFLRLSRTLLLVFMIAISMALMLCIEGLYDGMTLSMIDKSKRSDSGEISIYHKNYRISKALKDRIKNATKIRDTLAKYEDIEAITLRTKAEGLSQTARKSAFSTMIAIDLQAEEKFGNFSKFLKYGKIHLGKNSVIIGSELFKKLKIKIGSKIIFSTQDSAGEITAISLKVQGVVQTGNIKLDVSAIFIDKSKLDSFLNINPNSATQIAIRTKVKSIKERLSKIQNIDIKHFFELYPMLKQMQEMMIIFNSISFSIVMLLVFIGIMGVMYVSILDRIREFGIMKSIGMKYEIIRMQIIFEALFMGFIGYFLGAILGFLALLYLSHYGLNLGRFSDAMESFGMHSIIYASLQWGYFINTFIAIMFASFLSIILPLKKIKNMNIIDVVKANI